MDKREFATLAATMEEYYGRNQITKSAASMDIWYELIGDIPYEQCKNAVRQLMATSNFFPSAAEIRKLCTQIEHPEALSIDDAWGNGFESGKGLWVHAGSRSPGKPAGTMQERGEEHWLAEHLQEREHHGGTCIFP